MNRHDREPSVRAAAPWVRTRLRAAPWTAGGLALVVLVTAFLAAVLPRALDAYEDTALRRSVGRAALTDRTVSVEESLQPVAADSFGRALIAPRSVDEVERDFERVVRPPLVLAPAVYGARAAVPPEASDRYLPQVTSGLDARAALFAQRDVAGHARLRAGAWPRGAADGSRTVEAAVTAQTARRMRMRVGSAVHVTDATGSVLTVRVTGIVVPRGPAGPFWREEPSLVRPALMAAPTPPGEDTRYYWQFGLLVDRASSPVLLTLEGGAQLYWQRPVDGSALTARQVPAVLSRLASLSDGPTLVRMQTLSGHSGLTVDERLDTLLGAFRAERDATEPVVLIAGLGVGAVMAVVLLLAAGLAASRRRAELALLRSRGASLRGLAGLLLAETAAAAWPAAALGTALALAAGRSDRWLPSVLLGVLVALVAALALPVRAVWEHRRPRGAARGREDLVAARPSRRRLVLELTVLVLVAGAVAALLRRGGAAGADPLVAATPVLLGVAAALVLLRLYPLPLRLLGRPAARLSGAVTHLGLARAGRAPATAALPLLALLLSLTVASVGGSVLTAVAAGRDRAALAQVGADARIDSATALPAGLPAAVSRVPGVRATVAVRYEPELKTLGSGVPYDLVVADPAAYARLVAATGIGGPFPAGALDRVPAAGPLPAVVSPGVAQQFGRGAFTVPALAGDTPVRAAAVVSATSAAPDSDFVIVSSAGLAARHPVFRHGSFLRPTTLFVVGSGLDAARLRSVAAAAAPGASLTLRSAVRSRFGTPLQTGARRIYLAAVAAGGGYSVLALLLALLRAAPERSTLLARLRTMGMTRRQSRRLVLLEMMPQALLAAGGGVLVSLAAIGLLRSELDVGVLAFGADRTLRPPGPGPVLRPDWVSLAAPALGTLLLAGAVLAAQAWWAGRRRESADLRAGDRG